jgi:uncharacterized SAM-binding protein YcdF (DUF218 family)
LPNHQVERTNTWKGTFVKQILARLSLALMALGAMALTTGAGMRWN